MTQITNVRADLLTNNVDLDLLDDVIAHYFPEDRDQAITDLARATAGVQFIASVLHNQPNHVGRLLTSLHTHILDLMVGNVQDNGII